MDETGPEPAPPVMTRAVVLSNFRFAGGEQLAEIRLHHRTLGTPRRNAEGLVDNAVLLLHSTSSTGAQFLDAGFAGELFGPGQPLDATRYFLILPDAIGHGQSSKPSDGLRGTFPRYSLSDIVAAERRALKEAFDISRVRLVLGTSMGGMLSFLWAETHPDMVQAAMPIACLPTQIAGHHRLWRIAVADAFRADPAWEGGNYQRPPVQALRTAASVLAIAGGLGPLAMQRQYPTTAESDAFWHKRLDQALNETDANDLLYQVESSRDYDAESDLDKASMPVTWVNIGDDFINLPGSKIVADCAQRLPNGRFYLVPISAETLGHRTHSFPRFWKQELSALLARSP